MTCPRQELLALQAISLEQADLEIAARDNLAQSMPVTEAEPFELGCSLYASHLPIPRIFGLTALGRPGASGEIFALGKYHVVIDGSALADIDIRVWIAAIKLAAKRQSTIVETGVRELASSAGESWGGDTGKRIWLSLERLRTVRVRVTQDSRLIFDGALLGAVWRGTDGAIGAQLVGKTVDLLMDFGRLETAAWGALGAPGRKIGAWIVCQRGVKKIGREKWTGLLGWVGRPAKEVHRDLRVIMARIEEIGLVKGWTLDRRGMLEVKRPR